MNGQEAPMRQGSSHPLGMGVWLWGDDPSTEESRGPRNPIFVAPSRKHAIREE